MFPWPSPGKATDDPGKGWKGSMENSQTVLSKIDGIIQEVLFTFSEKAREKEGTSFLILRGSKLLVGILQPFFTASAPGI